MKKLYMLGTRKSKTRVWGRGFFTGRGTNPGNNFVLEILIQLKTMLWTRKSETVVGARRMACVIINERHAVGKGHH